MTIEKYIADISEDRVTAFEQLRATINDNIPKGFEHCIQYKMPGWVVPLSTYPDGYHCTADTPLPFASIANQKNFIALYHMGLYADEQLLEWFTTEYKEHCKYKLDMGKSCIRFKKMDDIPFDLVAQLMRKITTEDWVKTYESTIKK